MIVQQAVRWLRVAWWATLVGIVEGLIWLSAARRLLVAAVASVAIVALYVAHAHQTSTRPAQRAITPAPFSMAPHAVLIPNAIGRGIAVPIPLAHGTAPVHPISALPAGPAAPAFD